MKAAQIKCHVMSVHYRRDSVIKKIVSLFAYILARLSPIHSIQISFVTCRTVGELYQNNLCPYSRIMSTSSLL